MVMKNEDLFKAELNVLQAATEDVADKRFAGNELMPRYKLLAKSYRKLLMITKKVFHISDIQGRILQRRQSEIQNLLDNANQGFLTFGQDLKVDRQYSAECDRIFGRKIAGFCITELLGSEEDTLPGTLERVFLSPKESQHLELQKVPARVRIGHKDIQVECKLISQPEDTENSIVMMILTDITERLRAEEQIHFLSYHDKLTSLHNRAYIEAVLPAMEKQEVLPLSVIMVDMNGLKLANDVFGHQQGDLLLTLLARALQKSCRKSDIVARWGGDEFVILLPNTNKQSCLKVCERIRSACNETADGTIPLSAALGTATKETGAPHLAELLSVAESVMYSDKLLKSKEVRRNIVANLESMLTGRCFENEGHTERVQEMLLQFAAFLETDSVSGTPIKLLTKLAKLHDIGKVAIPAEILGSPRALSGSDWEVMKSHSEIGYRLAFSLGETALAEIMLAVHERWDGLGYPCGLKGEQIPFIARMFSVVDVYDVITHSRPYKGAMDKGAALAEIAAGSGTQFDPEIVRSFQDFMGGK